MSRIGKKLIEIPSGVTVAIDGNVIMVKGSKGELSFDSSFEVAVEAKDNQLEVKKVGKTKNAAALWGTTRSIIANMIEGVSNGFKKQLELNGVGYKMAVSGSKLNLNLGYSHPVEMEIPQGLTVAIEKNVLTIEGIDKQAVGLFTAKIREKRKVEPYKGKGFRYVGEQVIRKEGKRAAASE
jgi:large subunit ribosomal protein L6